MIVGQVKQTGVRLTPLCRWIEGKWVVSDGAQVIAWFAREADARRFAGGV